MTINFLPVSSAGTRVAVAGSGAGMSMRSKEERSTTRED